MKKIIGCFGVAVLLFVIGLVRMHQTEEHLVISVPLTHHITLQEPSDTMAFEWLVHEDLTRYLDKDMVEKVWLHTDESHIPLRLETLTYQNRLDHQAFKHVRLQVSFSSWLEDSVLSVDDAVLSLSFLDDKTMDVLVGDVYVFKNMATIQTLDYERIDNIVRHINGMPTSSGALLSLRRTKDIELDIIAVHLHPETTAFELDAWVDHYMFKPFQAVDDYHTDNTQPLPAVFDDDQMTVLIDFNVTQSHRPIHAYGLLVETNQGMFHVPSFTFINTDLFKDDHHMWFVEGAFYD